MRGLNNEPWLDAYIPESGRLALDVGANVGDVAEVLLDRFAEVHCFEPNPQALDQLHARAGSRPNATVFETAVGDRVGELELLLYTYSYHASVFAGNELDTSDRGPAKDRVTVPIASLDALGYADRPVDFVKVDTEGYETHILEGARLTLAASLPGLLIEIHTVANGERCTELLSGLGYAVMHIPHPHPGVFAGHHWLAADRPS